MSSSAKPPAETDSAKPLEVPFEEAAMKAFGSKRGPSASRLLQQILLATNLGTGPDDQMQAIVAVVGLVTGLKPRDEIEQMLVAQMIATHEQAMEFMRRAASADQTFFGFEMYMKYADKLLKTFTRQMEALDKHRGKGQQKITVEHVTVHAGGQAVVGNVETAPQDKRTEPPAPALEHQPDVSVPLEQALGSRKERVPISARTRGRAGSGD